MSVNSQFFLKTKKLRIDSQSSQLADVLAVNSQCDNQVATAAVAMTKRPDVDGSAASAAVILDRALFSRIALFQPGYPHAVAAMVRSATREQLQSADGRGRNATERRTGALPRLAVAVGDSRMLTLLFDLQTQPQYQRDQLLAFEGVMALAVRYKRVDMLTCLGELKERDPSWQWEPHLMSNAAGYGGGDLRVLTWLYEHLPRDACVLQEHFLVPVVRRGSVEEVQWLHERGYSFTTYTADCAASSQATSVLTYLYEHTTARCSVRAVWQAAASGSLAVVKIILPEHSNETHERALDCAARYGHLDVVYYLVENRFGVSSRQVLDEAAQTGNLEVLTYLHAHVSGSCSTRAMDGAALCGQLGVVAFLHEHRLEGCTTNAMDSAAAYGHVDVVQFLHKHRREGCSTKAIDSAAEFGHLDVVRFLHEHRSEGCTARALEAAVANLHLDVVAFLCEHRSEGDVSAAMASAAASGRLEAVELLSRWQRPSDSAYPALKVAAQNAKADVVRFLCERERQGADERHVHEAVEQEDETTSFLRLAVADGAAWVVQAVVPHATTAELQAAREKALSDGHTRVVRVLDRGLRYAMRVGE